MAVMQPIHLQSVWSRIDHGSSALLLYMRQDRSCSGVQMKVQKQASRFFEKTVTVLAVLTVLIGGGLSLFASGISGRTGMVYGKVAGTTELDAKGTAYKTAAEIQEHTALLPDYAFKNNNEGMAGTSFSGSWCSSGCSCMYRRLLSI